MGEYCQVEGLCFFAVQLYQLGKMEVSVAGECAGICFRCAAAMKGRRYGSEQANLCHGKDDARQGNGGRDSADVIEDILLDVLVGVIIV